MCKKIKLDWSFKHNGKKWELSKIYEVPSSLGWCPVCDAYNPEKIVLWKQHICKQLFKEDCMMMVVSRSGKEFAGKKLMHTLPSSLEELERLYDKLAIVNIKLRRELQEELCEESVTQNISVVAPFMNKRKKNVLKKSLKDSKDILAVLETTKGFVGDNYEIDIQSTDKRLAITIKEKQRECQVCFVNLVTTNPMCKTCKEVNICTGCESDACRLYKRCPFCNTSYEQSL